MHPNLRGSFRIAVTVEASGKVVSTRPMDAEWRMPTLLLLAVLPADAGGWLELPRRSGVGAA